MRFADSETQRLLRTTARSYLAEAYPWERLYRIESGEERLAADDIKRFADLGWLALAAPERFGGGGGSLLDAAVLVEEFGYGCVPAPVAVANIAASLLPERGAGLILPLASGEQIVTIAESLRRPHGANETALVVDGGRVSGTIRLVPFADLCAFVLAPALVDGESAFVALPLGVADLEPVALIDRRCYANVRFSDASADGALVLAKGSDALALQERCDALVTAFGVIETAGMMQRVLEMTRDHISTRVQFGQPVAKFQAARHRAAELLMQVETVRWAAYHALWRFEMDGDASEIWLAKHWAVRAADRVFQIAHLLHGGVGVGVEHPLHLFTQGIAALAVRGGTMNEMVSRTLDSLRLAPAVEGVR